MYEVRYIFDDCLELYGTYATIEHANNAKTNLENKFKSDYGFEKAIIVGSDDKTE